MSEDQIVNTISMIWSAGFSHEDCDPDVIYQSAWTVTQDRDLADRIFWAILQRYQPAQYREELAQSQAILS